MADDTQTLVPTVNFDQALQDAAGQLGKRSGRIYANDAQRFAEWIQSNGLTVQSLTRSDLIACHKNELTRGNSQK